MRVFAEEEGVHSIAIGIENFDVRGLGFSLSSV